MMALKFYACTGFKPDGTRTIGVAASDPEMQKMLENSPQDKTIGSAASTN